MSPTRKALEMVAAFARSSDKSTKIAGRKRLDEMLDAMKEEK